MSVITIKDVAADAGVSVGTVSKVLNELYVKPANKEKVDRSIERLGYQVNTYARGMRAQQTHTIAIIIPDLLNPFFAQLVNYVEEQVNAKGYRLLVCIPRDNEEQELSYINMLKQNKVDGLIALTYSNVEEYLEADLPMVSIDRHFQKGICCVCCDSAMGGRLAAEKFIQTGCKKVIYIRSGSTMEESEPFKRGVYFNKTCREAGIDVSVKDFGEETVLYDDTIRDIESFIASCAADGKCIYDGIFTSSDIHAYFIRRKLCSLGVRIPQDVQIIGYDGLRVLNMGENIVSSIEQPTRELAQACTDVLLKLIEKKPVSHDTVLPVRFVDGGTTR